MSSPQKKIYYLNNAIIKLPEYAEILPLFLELYRYLELADGTTGITFKVLSDVNEQKMAAGLPLLSPEEMLVDMNSCTSFITGVIGLLKTAGRDGADDLACVERAMLDGKLDFKILFQAIMERNRKYLDDTADSIGCTSALLEYILEIPLKSALENISITIVPENYKNWHDRMCPVCGARAGMAELRGEEGRRYLSCSTCNYKWQFKRMQCPYCGNDDPNKLSYFTVGEGLTRVDTCQSCNRYIKTYDSRKANEDIPLDIEDLLTIHLDLIANKEGFERGK